jgi:hypothetical protein
MYIAYANPFRNADPWTPWQRYWRFFRWRIPPSWLLFRLPVTRHVRAYSPAVDEEKDELARLFVRLLPAGFQRPTGVSGCGLMVWQWSVE